MGIIEYTENLQYITNNIWQKGMDHKGIDYKIKRGCVKMLTQPLSISPNFKDNYISFLFETCFFFSHK